MKCTALARVVALILAATGFLSTVRAQNPVQWSGTVEGSVARAREQMLPLLFWITGGSDRDDDDLNDAQEECFRDPRVVDIIHKRFVPVRVARNSRVIAEAERLGLPTEFGLYCAVLTADGQLLDRMGPEEVADPAAFAEHLVSASTRYLDELYERELRPILENPSAPKQQIRLAAQTAWRLGIRKADAAIIGLLDRPDLTASERSRLFGALASMASEASITALLDRADDRQAAAVLLRCEPGALEWLIPAMPSPEGAATARELAAYRATVSISRLPAAKPDAWWESAGPEDRAKELERAEEGARAVLEYWRGTPRD